MNDQIAKLCEKVINKAYVTQAFETRRTTEAKFRILVDQKKLPQKGWDDATIELFIQELSRLDSNNFPGNCGAGEREARFASSIVERRHFRLGHGIGRSGDLTAVQPKAAGSSIMMKLTNALVLDTLKLAGAPSTATCFVVPMATGMTLTLCLLSLRASRPAARCVLWPRIDQKSCFKSIGTAGFEAIVIENSLEGDELRTDMQAMRDKISELGADKIAAVMTTTSCFAPRACDRLEDVAQLCKEHGIPHLVNNAYGIQSSKCMAALQQASRGGRVDLFVQSCDKNLMVPVGGAIVAGFDAGLVEHVSKTYPGRGSGAPSLDVLITLLGLGEEGYRGLLKQRKEVYGHLKRKLEECAKKHGERVLATPHNNISIGMTVGRVCGDDARQCTELGSMLFTRLVSGTRVVAKGGTNTINGHEFRGWGSHADSYPEHYITAAAAIGATVEEIDLFITRLDKTLGERAKQRSTTAQVGQGQDSPSVLGGEKEEGSGVKES